MSPALSVAASLPADVRQSIGIQVLSRSEPVSHLAAKHQVSRKFVYQQGDKAQRSLTAGFAIAQQCYSSSASSIKKSGVQLAVVSF